MKEQFSVTGMTCTACSSGIEKAVAKLNGVTSVEVSLMGERMTVEYDEEKLTKEEIIEKVRSLGYGATIFDENAFKEKKPETDFLKKRFGVSIAFLLPLMYLSMGGMIGLPLPNLFLNYCLQAILSAVIIAVNFKFFTVGVKAVVNHAPNMDTLVSLGAFTSYLYSLVLTIMAFMGHTNHHGSHLFFESAGMILTLVTLGKWLEEKSKRKTGEEVEKLIKLMPNTVTVETQDGEKTIAYSELSVGDILLVKQGDYIPVDGKIIEGNAFLDRSAITGESMPVEAQVGDSVTGADIVKSGYLKVQAERVGAQTALSQIIKMVKTAGASKAPIQKLADKIAGVFVPVVTLLSIVTFAIWWIVTKDSSQAFNYAISVLVISCPCSLGLATPVAVMAATGKGMSLGILFKDAEALQKAKNINYALLDKTATLTVGEPKVTDCENVVGDKVENLQIAYAIELKSNHPIAECIKNYAKEYAIGQALQVDDYRYEMGKGATAFIDKNYYLGNRKLVPAPLQAVAEEYEKRYSAQGKTVVFLTDDEKLLTVFCLADTLKEESVEAVTALKERNIQAEMLTGDIERVAKAICEKVGLERYFAEALPEDKAKRVVEMQSKGNFVAMIGDGINDSPALKSADIGVAMGTGTDIAIESADIVLVSGDLRSVATMVDLSKETVKNIKQNLFWAFFYNCVAIPVAGGVFAFAGIHLNPMISAACMSLSSLFVVTNALRLTRFSTKKNKEIKIEEKDNEMKSIFKVEGMMCQHCVARVTNAVKAVEGVADAKINLKKKKVEVILEKEVADETIVTAIVNAGYEAEKLS